MTPGEFSGKGQDWQASETVKKDLTGSLASYVASFHFTTDIMSS